MSQLAEPLLAISAILLLSCLSLAFFSKPKTRRARVPVRKRKDGRAFSARNTHADRD